MKAKEYYEKFLELEKTLGEKRAFVKTVIAFASEITDMAKTRNAHSNQALISIIKEQNQKWNALRKLDPRFKQHGLIEFLKYKMPFLKDYLVRK